MTQLVSCEPGGTAARQGGFIGSVAGAIEVCMPKFYLVYFSLCISLGRIGRVFKEAWGPMMLAAEDISVKDREEVFQVKDEAGPWI